MSLKQCLLEQFSFILILLYSLAVFYTFRGDNGNRKTNETNPIQIAISNWDILETMLICSADLHCRVGKEVYCHSQGPICPQAWRKVKQHDHRQRWCWICNRKRLGRIWKPPERKREEWRKIRKWFWGTSLRSLARVVAQRREPITDTDMAGWWWLDCFYAPTVLDVLECRIFLG